MQCKGGATGYLTRQEADDLGDFSLVNLIQKDSLQSLLGTM